MKIVTTNSLLYVHPSKKAAEQPMLDELTTKILWACRNRIGRGVLLQNGEFVKNLSTKGVHHCTGCGGFIHSEASDVVLPNGLITNTLAVHYVAHHRGEVPADDLAKIMSIESPENSECNPSEQELGKGIMEDYFSTH